jgi:hypothetical protein
MRPCHYAGRLTKIRDLDFIVPRECGVVDAYIF